MMTMIIKETKSKVRKRGMEDGKGRQVTAVMTIEEKEEKETKEREEEAPTAVMMMRGLKEKRKVKQMIILGVIE